MGVAQRNFASPSAAAQLIGSFAFAFALCGAANSLLILLPSADLSLVCLAASDVASITFFAHKQALVFCCRCCCCWLTLLVRRCPCFCVRSDGNWFAPRKLNKDWRQSIEVPINQVRRAPLATRNTIWAKHNNNLCRVANTMKTWPELRGRLESLFASLLSQRPLLPLAAVCLRDNQLFDCTRRLELSSLAATAAPHKLAPLTVHVADSSNSSSSSSSSCQVAAPTDRLTLCRSSDLLPTLFAGAVVVC